jgi:hypothetical protein
MKDLFRFIVTGTIILLLTSLSNKISSQVSIFLQQPPPNQLLIEDLWKLRVVNSSLNPYKVYLTATVTEATLGQVLSGSSKNFNVPTGIKFITQADLGSVNVQYSNGNIKNIIEKTGSVPVGYYEICVNLINADGSETVLASTCITQEVNNYTIPVLISPDDKAKISAELPVFNWLPPTPVRVNQRLTYTLKIVEILPRQSATDAMRSNPDWFIKSNINVPIYQFDFSSREFTAGNHYAWKVLAYVDGVFVNESIIREFIYSQNEGMFQKSPQKKSGKLSYDDNSRAEYSQTIENQVSLGLKTIRDLKTELYVKSLIREIRLSNSEGSYEYETIAGSSSNSQMVKTPNIMLYGSSRLFGQNANRQGTNQLLPQKLARWEFNPSISFYKIPFNLNLLLSTEQSNSKQNINNVSFNFDPYSLIEQAKNKLPEHSLVADKLKEYDKLKSFVEDPGTLKDIERLKELEKLNTMDSTTMKEYSELKNKEKQYNDAKQKLQQLEPIKKDLDELRNTNDPNIAADKLKKYGAFSPVNSFLLSFRTFGIGTTYPNYTNLTLNSIPLTGANIEFNPGYFYLAVAGLKNNKAIQVSDNGEPVFARKVFATRIGGGKYDGTHFYLTYLYAKDDEYSVHTDSTTIVTPAKDHLLGLETKVSALNNKLLFEGEISGSLYTRDVTSPAIENSAIPDFLKNTFGIKMSTSVDYAYALRGTLNLDKYGTKFSAGFNMTGPGYISLGAPNIRNDNLGFEVKLDQSLLSNQILFSGYLRREKDNLISWKRSTTVNTFGNATLNLRFRNLPYLLILFSPNSQLNNQTADSLKVDNKTTLYNVSTGYGFNINNIFTFTNLTYSRQSGKTLLGIGDYSTKNFIAYETVSFTFPLSLSLGYSFSGSKVLNIADNINSYDFSGTYSFFDKWQNTLGGEYSTETGNNKRIGVYYSTSIPLWGFATFDLRAEKNLYKNKTLTSTNYDEFMLKATLTSKW